MPTDYFERVVFVLRNGATARGTAGVFVDKFVCIEQNDFARLYRSVPIRNTQPGARRRPKEIMAKRGLPHTRVQEASTA
jgi:hypothetical protein